MRTSPDSLIGLDELFLFFSVNQVDLLPSKLYGFYFGWHKNAVFENFLFFDFREKINVGLVISAKNFILCNKFGCVIPKIDDLLQTVI